MVERVDRVLRDELGVADGLADESVYVLDPACGTGAYLAAVLERIYHTMRENYGVEQAASAVRSAVRNIVGEEPAGRIFGFELLAAPFVVAHLQLGLLLQRLEAPLEDDTERAGVYLTNTLTGWEPGKGKDRTFVMRQLRQESGDADAIKQGRRILVVMGNPPYNAFAGTSPQAERIAETEGLVDRYKEGLQEKWGIKKYNLDELYVRFFRIAERCIAEFRGEGVVCYISNFSYLNGDSFTVMREHFLSEFDHLWIDNLNGDSRETGKRTPAGKADPSVFSTDLNKAGIRKGTAICTMVRSPAGHRPDAPTVKYRAFWGKNKRAELLDSLEYDTPPEGSESQYIYEVIAPTPENQYCFRPLSISAEYYSWPLVTELCAIEPISGPKENRGFSMIDSDKSALAQRMEYYFDPTIDWKHLDALDTGLTRDAAGFPAKRTWERVRAKGLQFEEGKLLRYWLRPFELQWCYYISFMTLWNRTRPALSLHHSADNMYLITRPAGVASPEGIPFFFSRFFADFDFIRGHSYHIPVFVRPETKAHETQADFLEHVDQINGQAVRTNLSNKAHDYLSGLGIDKSDVDAEAATLIWLHVLAVGYSPQYLEENTDGVQSNWPRIPLPDGADLLRGSATLGEQVAALLDTERKVKNVTGGDIRAELRGMGLQQGRDLAITARWGYRDSRGAVMPGPGDATEREYTPDELASIEEGAAQLGLELDDGLALLGDKTFDLHLNDETCWANVPANVYAYTIGGYQVIKKWLSYRNEDVMGRALKDAEAMEVTHMVRRIAALILLQPQLNTNYRAVAAAAYDWPRGE
jgi:SAM-dependent methyltransferase